MTTKEKTLLRRASRYDEKALAEVYDSYSPGIYRYAMRLLGDVDLAEECVAETFSRFLMALQRGLGPRDYLQAYLYRVAHNWITDHYRHQPQQTEPLESEVHAAGGQELIDIVSQRQEQQRVRAALATLTPDQRQVVVLKFLEGWRNEEIARSMGKPVGAIKSLQHRALDALRRTLVFLEENQS
ncbi:MAG: RNA polymerase sigma factor [Chloroflexota bacterium]